MATITNSATIIDICTQRVHALDKHVAPKTEISINGEKLKATGVKQIYQDCLDSHAAMQQLRAKLKAAIADRAAAELRRREADRALRGWVANEFGEHSQEVHEFGFPPRRPAIKSTETKYGAVLQARATRKARHTMGTRQKESVVGVVVVPRDVTQSTQAEQPATHTAPSTAAEPTRVPAIPASSGALVNGQGTEGASV